MNNPDVQKTTVWQLLISPHASIKGDTERRRLQIFSGVILGFLGATLAIYLITWLSPSQFGWLELVMGGLLVVTYVLTKTPAARAAVVIFVAGAVAEMAIGSVVTNFGEGIHILILVIMALPTILTALVSQTRIAAAVAGTTFLVLVGALVLGPQLSSDDVSLLVAVHLAIGALSVGYAWSRDRDLFTIRRQARELKDYSETLETRIEARTRDLELAAEVSQQVATVLDLQELLPRVVDLSRRNFSLYHVQVYLFESDGERLIMEAGTGEAGQQLKAAGHSIPLNAERSLVASAGRSRKPVIVNDVVRNPDHLPNPLLPKTRAELAVPMVVGDRLVGVLDVQAEETGRFDPDTVPVLQTLAGQIAVAVQNARAFAEIQIAQAATRQALDQLEQRDRFLTGITEIATMLLNEGVGALNAVLALLGRVANVNRVYVLRNEVETDGTVVMAPANEWTDGDIPALPEDQQEVRPYGDALARWLEQFEAGESIMGPVAELPEAEQDALTARGVQSVLLLPLFVEGGLYGYIGFDDYKTERAWTQQEVDLLRTASTSISYALAGNRLLERTQEALFQVETLYGVSQSFMGAQTPGEIVDAFLSINPNLSDATANLYYIDTDSNGQPIDIWLAASNDPEAQLSDHQPFASFEYAVTMLANPYDVHLIGRENKRTGVAIPLAPIGRDWIGALLVTWPTPRAVSDNEAQLFSVVAPQMATVVNSLRLFDQTRRSESLFRSVIDASTDWIWAKDRNHDFLLVNRSLAEQAYDADPAEMIGTNDYDYFPKELVDGDPERGIRGFREDDLKAFSGEIIHNPYDVVTFTDGSEHVLDTIKMPLRDADGAIIGTIGVGRDITEAHHARERQRAGFMLGQRLNQLLDPDELLVATVNSLVETFDYYHAHIYLLDDKADRLFVAHGLGEAGQMMKENKHSIPLDAERSLVARAGRTREPVVVDDVSSDPEHLPNPLLPFTRSEVAVPLVVGDRLIGVLDVQQKAAMAFGDSEIQLLTTVSNQLAIALNNARLFEEVRQSNRSMLELQQAVRTSPEAVFMTDLDGIFTYVNPAFTEIYGFTEEELLGKQTPRVLKSGLIPDEQYKVFWDSLLGKDQIVGEIVNKTKDGRLIHVQGSNAAITDEDGEVVGFVGIHTDITERVLTRTRQQSAYTLGQQLNQLLDPEELLSVTVQSLAETFDYYHAHVYLFDEDSQRLVMAEGLGDAGQMMKEAGHSINLNAERSLVARAGRNLEPVVVDDVTANPGHLPNPLLPFTLSEVAVPLTMGSRLVGVLDVQQKATAAFNQDEIGLLTIVANQLAVSLSNATLFAETQAALAETELLYAGSDRIVRSQSVEEVLDGLCESSALGRYDRTGIYLFDKPWSDEPTLMTVLASRDERIGGNPAPVGTEYAIQDFPILSYLTPDEPIIVVDVEDDERADDNTRDLFINRLKMRGLSAYPLVAGGEFFGVVMGQMAEVTEVEAEEVRQVGSLVDQAASVLRSIRLFDQTSRSQVLLRQVLDAVPDWIFVKDEAFRFLVVNKSFAEFYGGLTPEQMIGKDDYDLGTPAELIEGDPERDIVGFRTDDRRVLEKGEVVHNPYDVVLYQDGSEHIYDTMKMPLTDEQGDVLGVLGYARDMTEDIRARRREELALEVGRQLTTLLDRDDLLRETVTTLATAFDYYHTHIYLFDEGTGRLTMAEGLGEAGVMMKEAGHSIALSAERSLVARAGRARSPVVVNDVTADPEHLPNPLLPFTRSEVAVPLVVGDELVGVLDVQQNRPNAFVDSEVGMLSTVANQLAIALSNAELYDETARSQALLRQVLDAVPDWIFAKDKDYRYLVVNKSFAEFYGGLTPDEMVGKDDYDLGTPAELIEGDPERGIAGFRTDDVKVVEGREQVHNPNDVVVHQDGSEHIYDTLKLPLSSEEDDVIGVLGYSRDMTEDIRARRREELAQEVGRQLTTLLDRDELLRETVNTLSEAFNYYHAHIYMYDPESNRLVMAEGLGEAGQMLKESQHSIALSAERSLVARAGRSQEPVVVNDVSENPDHLPNPLLPETRSEVAVPLAVGSRLLGVLDVQQSRVNAFNESEVGMLSTVANQLAVALSNAALYQEQLRTAERLMEVDQLKNEFLANMSHELRTPLNSIIGYSELLIDEIGEELDEMSREDLQAIHSSGQHLLAIINDILDLAKIEAGRMELTTSHIALGDFIDQVVDAARVLVKDKPDVKLIVDIKENTPDVEGDPIRLRQVMWNLLSNAIKFTEEGHVRLSALRKDGMVEFAVEDTGIGIAPEHHALVFDQFRQADGSATRKAGGTGLGLTITKQLVQMHGGDLWLESNIGKGSTFYFTLPIVEEAAEDPTADVNSNGRHAEDTSAATEQVSAD